jgi:hypothetical protein
MPRRSATTQKIAAKPAADLIWNNERALRFAEHRERLFCPRLHQAHPPGAIE